MKSAVTTFARTLGLVGGALACSLLITTASAHIAGTVFCDSNGNGILDQGEPRIAGVKVTVCDLTKFTDANGNYFFSAAELSAAICVPPLGSRDPWVVSVDASTAPGDCNGAGCPTSVMVFVTPADNVNFCFRPPPPGCCPPPNPFFGLGPAGQFSVLGLAGADVVISEGET